MFDFVVAGKPWWFWFKKDKEYTVHKVVRDGSGGLWVEHNGYSAGMYDWLTDHKCLGPVEPVEMEEG